MLFRRAHAALLLAAVVVAACQKADVSKRRSALESETPAPPTGKPVDLPGGITSGRATYQTRAVVELNVAAGTMQSGDPFTLTNETTQVTIIDTRTGADALGFSLEQFALSLRLYPADPALIGKLVYGENRMRLLTGEGDGVTTLKTVELRDFPAFGVTSTAFPSGSQSSSGLQGGFEPFGKVIVEGKGKSTLTTGFMSISNR